MKLNRQLVIGFLVSFVGFIAVSLLVSANHIVRLDGHIISFIQGTETAWLTTIMKFFTFIGTIRFIAVLSLFVLFFLLKVLKHRLEILIYLAVVFSTPILNRLLKLYFERARPDLHRLIEIGGYSFPSGHAMNAFSFYSILAFLLWRHVPTPAGRVAVILFSGFMIAAIGTSRIYLGVHYPSDVIAGYLASGFWVTTVIWVFQRYQERHFPAMAGAQN
ncbi:phosphatase PAP2 family protein [Heyndrickxia sp. MSNUG]|uniref:phosphatase PAP2 family protein n=1 Tax=Heyndrickxia sp. MSNUG TaxID=3136677 RepID=UPI003C2DFF0E